MRNAKGMKTLTIVALAGVLALGLATMGFAQTVLGPWPGTNTADPAKTSSGKAIGPDPSFSYSVLGSWPGTNTADPAKTSAGPPTGPTPGYSYSVLGPWAGTNTADPAKTTAGAK